MVRPGILGLVQLAGGLILAAPMGIIGVEFLRMGRPLFGVGFLLLAVLLLALPEFVMRRIGSPRRWIRARLGRVVGRFGSKE